MPLENLADLEAEWNEFMFNRPGGRGDWTQDQKWRDDNPGKLSALLTYRNGGARPNFSTSLQGSPERRMLRHLDAWLKAKGNPTPPPPVFMTSLQDGMSLDLPYTWTFTPGDVAVAGYFYADGQELRRVDGPGPYSLGLEASSLTNGAHQLGHAWDTAAGEHKTPPGAYNVTVVGEDPLPPPTGSTYTLVDFETGDLSQWHGGISNPGAWQVVQSSQPATPAKGQYMAMITLGAGGGAAEAGTRGAPPPDNQWANDRWPMAAKLAGPVTDYFSFSWFFPLNWPGATYYQANAGLTQLAFNGLANTTLQIHNQSPVSSPPKTPGSLELAMLTGKVSYPGEGTFPNPGSSTFTPGTQTYEYNTENKGLGPYFTGHKVVPESRYALGVWHLVILGVTYATGPTGRVQAWHKRKGVDAGWTQTLDLQNVPTVSWGWAAAGTTNAGNYMNQVGKDKNGADWQAINKVGPYFGDLGSPRTFYMDCFAISTSLAAAKAALE